MEGTQNIYMAVTEKIQGKNYAYALTVPRSENLVHVFAKENNLTHANVCATKKEAERIADFWNECYKNNGTYLYSDEFILED